MESKIIKIITSWEDLTDFLNNKDNFYKTFRLKTKNKWRRIHSPINGLKEIQRDIVNILNEIPLPEYITGFVCGKSIKYNAEKHVGQRIILSMDIEDFFESTNTNIIKRELKRFLNDNYCIDLLTNIATYDDYLPQGAPTSPILANFSFLSIDEKLNELAQKNSGIYTRYADDLCLSSSDRGITDLKRYIELLVEEYGYRIKQKKTRYYTRGDSQMVTGLVVNEKVQPPRLYRYNLKAKLYNMARKGCRLTSHLKHTILGEYNWVKKFNKNFAYKYLKPNLDMLINR